MEKKVALVTGGSKGIGLEAVLRFCSLDYHVITCARCPDTWDATVDKHPILQDVDFQIVDLAQSEQLEKLFETIQKTHKRLDVAVNNASPKLRSKGPITDVPTAYLHETLVHDLWVHVLCMKLELPLMKKGGAIVNVSSVNGIRPTPYAAMYSAAKHGLEGLTRSVALEAIPNGIRVNAVAPGATWTPRWEERKKEHPEIREDVEKLVPIGRFASPAEVVNAIEWLCSEKASYIVGQTLVVDGGISLK